MQLLNIARPILLAALGSSCSATESPTFVGTWACTYGFERESGSSNNWWSVTYSDDGTYDSFGGAMTSIDLGELETSGSESGRYSVENGTMTFTIEKRENQHKPLSGVIANDPQRMHELSEVLRRLDADMIGTTLQRTIVSHSRTRLELLDEAQDGDELVYCERESTE